jgi:hypothetical protein
MNTVSRSWPGERQQSELEGVRHASIDLTVGIGPRPQLNRMRDSSGGRRASESPVNMREGIERRVRGTTTKMRRRRA